MTPRVALVALAMLVLAGCGSRPLAVPQVRAPAAPGGFQSTTFREAGVRLAAPRTWIINRMPPPLLAVISSNDAVISLWRYRRTGTLPADQHQLALSSRRLVAAALRREPKLRVLGARVDELDGHPSVEVDAIERIGGARRQVRSLHIFTGAAEVVLEEYAPSAMFARVNRLVFGPVQRSLVVLRP